MCAVQACTYSKMRHALRLSTWLRVRIPWPGVSSGEHTLFWSLAQADARMCVCLPRKCMLSHVLSLYVCTPVRLPWGPHAAGSQRHRTLEAQGGRLNLHECVRTVCPLVLPFVLQVAKDVDSSKRKAEAEASAVQKREEQMTMVAKLVVVAGALDGGKAQALQRVLVTHWGKGSWQPAVQALLDWGK